MSYPEMIQLEEERLKTAFLPFVPAFGIYLTQGFGKLWQPNVYAQFGMLGHNGLDWGMPYKTLCIAVEKCTIIKVDDEGQGGYGRYVRLQNMAGDQYVYGHLFTWLVKVNQIVNRGDPICLSDNTGFSSGDHLHFALRPKGYNINNGFKGYVDPTPKLQAIYKEIFMADISTCENWSVVASPSGRRGFIKYGKIHKGFAGPFVSDREHYLFVKNSKFITDAQFDSWPKGTLSAQDILNGKKD